LRTIELLICDGQFAGVIVVRCVEKGDLSMNVFDVVVLEINVIV
jgi:hypothetical protein